MEKVVVFDVHPSERPKDPGMNPPNPPATGPRQGPSGSLVRGDQQIGRDSRPFCLGSPLAFLQHYESNETGSRAFSFFSSLPCDPLALMAWKWMYHISLSNYCPVSSRVGSNKNQHVYKNHHILVMKKDDDVQKSEQKHTSSSDSSPLRHTLQTFWTDFGMVTR